MCWNMCCLSAEYFSWATSSHTISLNQKGGRKPWNSVNFVCAHDGFTLADLVTYNNKHNLSNGEDNNDGENHNNSWNCGQVNVTKHERSDCCIWVCLMLGVTQWYSMLHEGHLSDIGIRHTRFPTLHYGNYWRPKVWGDWIYMLTYNQHLCIYLYQYLLNDFCDGSQ